MIPKVGIIGYGWVGKAMHKLFPQADVYDPYLKDQESQAFIGTTKEAVNQCRITFVAVPTPNIDNGEGKLNTAIVEEAIAWCESNLIVVRSTVNPGDCERWAEKYKKNIVMQPEYLGETPGHPFLDPRTRQFMIIGGSPENRRKLIDLYATVYNANMLIRQVSLTEAEIIKLTENRAISFKVAQCQELYDVCEKAGVDYYTIQQAVYGDDPRFNLWFTLIYPEKRGFNSKCIPKDVYAWCAWAESFEYDPELTRAMLNKNKEYINANK